MVRKGCKQKYTKEILLAKEYDQKYPFLFTDREREVMDTYLNHPTIAGAKKLGINYRGMYEHIYRILAKIGIETNASKWESRKKMRKFIHEFHEIEKVGNVDYENSCDATKP